MTGGYRPGDSIGVVEFREAVYAAPMPDGPIVVLEGISALIWTSACGGPRETLVERVAAATNALADAIRADVERFVDDLERRGLLAFDDR